MIEARALWTDGDRYVGQASSGHSVVMDAGAEKSASSPMELVLIALCGCTASDVVSILRKKREPFTSVEVRATSERPETFPKVFHRHQAHLSGCGKGHAQGGGGCGPAFERKVLFGLGHAGEDRQNQF